MLSKFINSGDLAIDVEFGNQYSFFSGSKYGLCNINNYSECVIDRTFYAEIPEAKGKITEFVEIRDNYLSRKLSFFTKDNAFLFDFVSRYVVLSNDRNAYISDVEITHRNSNIYYQYSTNKAVKVPLGNKHWLSFNDVGSSVESYFDNVFYIRDESQSDGTYKWIVHHRKIVKPEYAELILRGCNPRIEGVIPYQKWIPRILKNLLFRIRERKYPNFPLMVVGIVNVKDNPLKLITEIRLSEDA